MNFRPKEQAKLDNRRKMWNLFEWYWAFKRNNGTTEYTSDEGKGYGYFRNNHSLKCGCSMCQIMVEDKRLKKKKLRSNGKNEVRELLKLVNGNELE